MCEITRFFNRANSITNKYPSHVVESMIEEKGIKGVLYPEEVYGEVLGMGSYRPPTSKISEGLAAALSDHTESMRRAIELAQSCMGISSQEKKETKEVIQKFNYTEDNSPLW